MVNTKPLTILHNAVTYSVSISSTISDTEIYEYLRAYLSPLIGASHIIIKKTSGELAQLSYTTLKAGTVYTIVTSAARMKSAVPTSAASQRTAQNLAVICAHWGLQDASATFPSGWGVWEGISIAPQTRNAENKLLSTRSDFDTALETPETWSRTFTDELRSLSMRTQGRHEDALRLLVEIMADRLSGGRDVPVACVSLDVKRAVARLVEGQAQGGQVGTREFCREAVSGLQAMAQQAAEELKEVEAMEMFGGGAIGGIAGVE